MRPELVFCKNRKIIDKRVLDGIDGSRRFDILRAVPLRLIFMILQFLNELDDRISDSLKLERVEIEVLLGEFQTLQDHFIVIGRKGPFFEKLLGVIESFRWICSQHALIE